MCDCKTGYIQDIIVYTGSETQITPDRSMGDSGTVMITMLEKYLDREHVLYTDNWYTSPVLAYFLLDKNTGLCGTVKRNQKHMPKIAKLAEREVRFNTYSLLPGETRGRCFCCPQ